MFYQVETNVNVCRSTSQTRVSASQGTTPRTGTMSSRDLRAARAARSARSTSPAKPRSSTLKNGTQAPPLQTRSLHALQMSTDDLRSGRAAREARQHTLPSVSRKKSQASAESRKSAVDDFHCEYDYARQGSDKMETVTPDDANNEDFAMYRRDNLSQDSYRVSDSRDSSVDRLEMRTKLDVEAEFIGAEPLDEAKLIQMLEQEQQLQESRKMEEQNADESAKLQQNEDMLRNDTEQAINGEEVHVIKAEWDLPESSLQTEVEKIISIETTRIVETVETTRVTPVTETYRRQKRLSRENAVRVVDEDVTSPAAETEPCTADTADMLGSEIAVPVSVDQDEREINEIIDGEKIKSFVVALIDDVIKKAVEEMKAACTVDEPKTREPTELNLTVTEKCESIFSTANDTENPSEEALEESIRVTAEDRSYDETLTEDENELEGSRTLELSEQNSEDTAESQITVVEVEASVAKQLISTVDEASDEPLDTVTHVVPEEAARQSPSDVASQSQEHLESAKMTDDTWTEDSLSSDVCPDTVQSYAEADQQTEEAVATETDAPSEDLQTAVNQTLTSSETEREEIAETTPVDSAEVCQETVAESEELREDAVPEAADKTSEDIPYVLHKRHIIPAAEKMARDTRLCATLPRHHSSRSRSLSPGHKEPVMLTSEQKRAQMMKIKASLVSMAAEMAALRSPQSPVGISAAPTKRVFDFVVCSRLPPRDSFSSRDDTLSPPDDRDITLITWDKSVSSTEKKPPDASETIRSHLPDTTLVEAAENAVSSESEPVKDLMAEASSSEPFPLIADSPSKEITTVHEEMSVNTSEIEGTDKEVHTTEVEKLQTSESLESQSESESKPIGGEAGTPELEDELNRILSECELHVAVEDNGSLASGVSGKFTDDSPEVEPSRDLEVNSQKYVVPSEDAALLEDPASISLSLPDTERLAAAAESYERPSPCIETDFGQVAESLLAEIGLRPPETPGSVQALESQSHELLALDRSDDNQQTETNATASGVSAADSAAKLAAAERRLLLELQTNDLAPSADNVSSSSHSLNDQLDAEVLQSFSTMPPAVDAACRLSGSSVDGPTTCGFGRNVHLLDWLEEQAQLRGVSVSPHSAEGHTDAVISDEDDVEHAVFEDNLQDIFAALEAEVMANPFLVPITPQTSDMCVNAMTSERFSLEDDSSLGVLEASGGIMESTCGVDAHHEGALALPAEELKQTGTIGITDMEGNIRRSQLSLSISSEGDVVVEHVNDLSDPLEVLEMESRTLPPQLRSKPVCLSSESDSLSDKCHEEEKLQDVGDVLDRVDESRRLSISDLDDDEHPLTTDVRPVHLASDTSSSSSVGPVCVDEEADALAALDDADNSTAGAAKTQRNNSDEGDEDVRSVSSSSAVDSDTAALGNFVEQVMLHHSAVSEVLDRDDKTAEREFPTEPDSAGRQLRATEAADEDTSRSEYTLTPLCEADICSTVAQEEHLDEVVELSQGAEAFADIAISDEDDVEQSIEHSLQDVFAALEAEVIAKQRFVPVAAQTSVIIDQDSFSDDRETPSDLVNQTSPHEQETDLPEFTEVAASIGVADEFLRIDCVETSEITDEQFSTKDSRQETAEVNVNRYPSPADVSKSSEADALEAHHLTYSAEDEENYAVELAYGADGSSEPTLTTDRHCVHDMHDDTLQRDTPEQTMQDGTVQRETNSKEIDTARTSHGGLVVLKETADGNTEGITKTEIAHATETSEFDSQSAEAVNVEDSAHDEVTSQPHISDNQTASSISVNTADCVVDESCVEESVKNTVTEVEAVEVDTRCSEPGNLAELDIQDVEERDIVTGLTDTDSAGQSQHGS